MSKNNFVIAGIVAVILASCAVQAPSPKLPGVYIDGKYVGEYVNNAGHDGALLSSGHLLVMWHIWPDPLFHLGNSNVFMYWENNDCTGRAAIESGLSGLYVPYASITQVVIHDHGAYFLPSSVGAISIHSLSVSFGNVCTSKGDSFVGNYIVLTNLDLPNEPIDGSRINIVN